MEVEACPVSISSVGTSPPRNRKRRSSTSSTSLSPGFAKENCLVSKSVAKRKRTISESKQQEKQQQIQQLRPTFWGWSPKQAKFKPKVMDGDGSLSDHPNPDSLALRSKWQPIVIESFIITVTIILVFCQKIESGIDIIRLALDQLFVGSFNLELVKERVVNGNRF